MNQNIPHPPAVRANPNAFSQAGVAAAVLFALVVGLLFLTLGTPGSAHGAGEAVGRIFLPVLLAALLTGWIARKSAKRWSFWWYLLVVFGFYVALNIVTAIGRMKGAA